MSPPGPPSSLDAELRETLDLLSQVVASLSERMDRQTEVLDRLVEMQARDSVEANTSPDRVAALASTATTDAVGKILLPSLTRLVGLLEELGGGKALLRERLRAMDREEARRGRWRTHPWAVVTGIPLALILLLAFAVPRAVAQAPITCHATGGTWYEASERYPAACLFRADARN
ncbi:hypothetical protein FHG66_18815 [Rubellimicrobium rubrum]|uniref:Uncharacterized protein n=1 Tax=Rubellimicrobium rubrum TaxID=2585369 RepID=A0A5C4MLM8_9RHOB|nr:hypothetical protein [Rubellimicrobium rubrum]TNC46477.1 hypothetical protein FHG66_18815 [Rubellimicrobium rubrum]